MITRNFFLITTLIATLTACGGGGGAPGTTGGSTTPTTPTVTPALFTTAPASLNLASGTTSPSYSIIGGEAPYFAASDTPSLLTANVSGSSFTVVASSNTGSGSITITDSKGSKILTTVTVPTGPALRINIPAAITLAPAATNFATVAGGDPFSGAANYVVNNSNPAVIKTTIVGSSLAITGLVPGTATLGVSDRSGSVITVNVTVPQTNTIFSDAPDNFRMTQATAAVYSIYGGNPSATDPRYSINVLNPNIIGVSLAGTAMTITGKAVGQGSFTVSDSTGASKLFTVDVVSTGTLFTNAPSALTLGQGSAVSYSINGGQGPYSIRSDKESLVTASIAGSTYTLTAASNTAGGSASIQITDAFGTKLNLTITVPAPAALATTAQPTVAMAAGAGNQVSYVVFGGRPPYSAVSSVPSNVTVSTPTVNGQYTLTGVRPGNSLITISDSTNATVTVAVTVTNGSVLSTTAPLAGVTIARQASAEYELYGGLPAYSVTSSNTSVATVELLTANTFRITGVSGGVNGNNAVIEVRDQSNARVSISVTVPATNVLTSTAPQSGVTIGQGISQPYTISGGLAPYTVVSGSVAIASVTPPAGNSFQITGVASGSTTVTVTDAENRKLDIAVTVAQPGVLFTVAPPSVSIVANNGIYSYAVSGGFPPYTASSDRPAVVNASVSGNSLSGYSLSLSSTSPNPGVATVTLSDSQAQTRTITVNVGTVLPLFTDAPAALTLTPTGGSQTYQISGGQVRTSGPAYLVNSSAPAVATVSVAGTVMTITPVAVGTATIAITDAAGTTRSIALTVSANTVGGALTPQYPTLTSILSSTAIPTLGTVDLTVSLRDPGNQPIAGQVVSITGPSSQVAFPNGTTALTNGSGVATFKVGRANLLATGAGAINASYAYLPGSISAYPSGAALPTAASTVNSYVGFELTSAQITLDDFILTATQPAYGTQLVQVRARLNGTTPLDATNPVAIAFTASCGQILPATVNTDSSGFATATFTATDVAQPGCSGKPVQINASTAGVVKSGTINVLEAPATSLSFISASPQRIYLPGSGGAQQSTIRFRLVDVQGTGIGGKSIVLSLRALAGPIANKAAFDTNNSTADVTVVTDSQGYVQQAVYAGSIPSSVIVNASYAGLNIDSSILTIASGRPAQSRVSLAFEKLSIEGYSVDGVTTNMTAFLADRNGNPVPDGTAVNFVVESGVAIPPVCTTVNSSCSVVIRSQGDRPSQTPPGWTGLPDEKYKGLVTVLAYAPGEMDFVDTDGNNLYDCLTDSFTPMGNAFKSDRWDPSYSAAAPIFTAGDFVVTTAGPGPTACPQNLTIAPDANVAGKPGTATGYWGVENVRKQAVIAFATGQAVFSNVVPTLNGVSYTVSDLLGNSLPTGSTITVSVVDNTSNNNLSCTVVPATATVNVPNTISRFNGSASFGGCAAGDAYSITVTSPLGVVTTRGGTL